MKFWKVIDKNHHYRPAEGTYEQWKALLREEADQRCVYCSIMDVRLGGIRLFQVEHYKPKKNKNFPEFAELINDYDNLFYVCPVCNTFKGNSWFDAADGDWTTKHFPNPTKYDYCDFFSVNKEYKLEGNHKVGKFLLARLHLNRNQLVRERKLAHILENGDQTLKRLKDTLWEIKEISKDEKVFDLFVEFGEIEFKFNQHTVQLLRNTIYTQDEMR